MKKLLDWESEEVANIFDELNFWSAPFGKLLLENIPMKSNATIVDIGFGTGFPLIEISQRFGEDSKIYGIDIWTEGITIAQNKINTLEIKNIEIIEASAAEIKLQNETIDLITSNLGVNNFEQKDSVYSEIHRILKPDGILCLTTNPIGTFSELFDLFQSIFNEMGWEEEQYKLGESIMHRNTEKGIIKEFEQHNFKLEKSISDSTSIRFVDAKAIMNHSLIRVGFRKYWEALLKEENKVVFFEKLTHQINSVIESKGEFVMTIPMVYLEFGKN